MTVHDLLLYWGMEGVRGPQAHRGRRVKTPADYLERIEGIHQVGGSRHLESVLGAAATLAGRIANPLVMANQKMFRDSRMPGLYKDFMGATRHKIAMKAIGVAEWAEIKAQNLLSDHLIQLGELDRGLLRAMFNKQYIKSVPQVNNHLTRSMPTSVLVGLDGVGSISILNDHVGAGVTEMKFLGNLGKLEQQTSATRAIVLLHEAAHVDFLRLPRRFDPTPGRLSPDRAKEKKLIEDINTWSLSSVSVGRSNAAAKSAINENWADALASMIMIKENPDNPSVLKVIEKMALERQRNGSRCHAKGFIDPNAACGFAINRVLAIKDRLPVMTADEVRQEAIRIASDAYLDMVESLDPNNSPEIKTIREIRLEGLVPDRNLDTGPVMMYLSDMSIEQVPGNLKNHPAFELIKYDWQWFQVRYPDQVGIITREVEIYGKDPEKLRHLMRFHEYLGHTKPFALYYGDLVHDGRVSDHQGMSKDVFEGRLAVAKPFAAEWDRATKNVAQFMNMYDRKLAEQFESTPGFTFSRQDRPVMPKHWINL